MHCKELWLQKLIVSLFKSIATGKGNCGLVSCRTATIQDPPPALRKIMEEDIVGVALPRFIVV